MSREELAEALAQQDWYSVLKHGATLYNTSNGELCDALRLAGDTALFMLEHPEMDEVSPRLAKIVRDHLP
jgi:hypothetical protein